MENELFDIQNKMYNYPYHYIPYFKKDGSIHKIRKLGWALEYFSYLNVISKWIFNIEPDSILDVGCGDGRLLNSIGKKLSKTKMDGIDISEKAIQFARCFSKNENVEFQVKSIENIKKRYDIVTAVEVLEHIPDKYEDRFFRQMFKKVNRGGNVLLSVPTTNTSVQSKHYRHYNENYINNLLNKNNIKYSNIIYRYVFKKDLYYKVYNKLTNNKFFVFESSWLNRIIWKHIKNTLLHLDSNEGLHLVINIKL